jgi:hypothetical protein
VNCVQNGQEIKNRRRAPPAPIDDQLVPLALSEVPHVEVEASIADYNVSARPSLIASQLKYAATDKAQ